MPQNLPRLHAWRNRGRRGITALPPVSVQSPLLSRPINRSHPWMHCMHLRILRLPLRSGGLRRGPSSSLTATWKTLAGHDADWTARRAGAQTVVVVRDNARARPREHRRPPLPLREGEQRICQRADSSRRRRLSDLIPSYPLSITDWRRSMRVPLAAAGRRRRRRLFTLLKGGG
jgi:hypothetical protein